MHIQKISIKNYRGFRDFSMEFQKGLNVIVGANNSGKTGLLYAIKLLSDPTISVDDFNKNNLIKYKELYLNDAPSIAITYTIHHLVSENDVEDESIIRLLPFLGMDELEEIKTEKDGCYQYNITATIKTVCALDSKMLGDYRSAAAQAPDYNGYLAVLKSFMPKYSWSYYNGASDTEATKKEATEILDIRFISAERSSEAVSKETRREIDSFAKDPKNARQLEDLKNEVSTKMKVILGSALERLSSLFEQENNDIGLARGNVSISHDMRPNVSVGEAYITEVKDTSSKYIVPLDYNGLGYNNLISIYMLVKLSEIKKGKDFRVLCLEEPEAHLHPAMQYKLFKYLKKLDETDNLNQQIFVTTHSSNITAVAGLENMYMIAYERSTENSDCKQQSLARLFADDIKETPNTSESNMQEKPDDQDDGKESAENATTNKDAPKSEKQDAKEHLSKFLDVTRSDMLFADKVVLVEGIAEKLLLPLFMEKCGCSYEDEHISIVEIGGKHFGHFIELFNGNAVSKKVLCITDRDFAWMSENDQGTRCLSDYEAYKSSDITHVQELKKRFPIDNLHIETQAIGGRTFEDELFLTNITNDDETLSNSIRMMRLVANDTIVELLGKNGLSFSKWDSNRPKASNSIVSSYLDAFKAAISKSPKRKDDYERLFFAELFLYYASGCKGDVALNILTDENIAKSIVVPSYIKEGLEWLLK